MGHLLKYLKQYYGTVTLSNVKMYFARYFKDIFSHYVR